MHNTTLTLNGIRPLIGNFSNLRQQLRHFLGKSPGISYIISILTSCKQTMFVTVIGDIWRYLSMITNFIRALYLKIIYHIHFIGRATISLFRILMHMKLISIFKVYETITDTLKTHKITNCIVTVLNITLINLICIIKLWTSSVYVPKLQQIRKMCIEKHIVVQRFILIVCNNQQITQ